MTQVWMQAHPLVLVILEYHNSLKYLSHTQLIRGLPQVDSFVVTELLVCHVPVITYDLANMFRWHVLLLSLNETKLPLLTVSL